MGEGDHRVVSRGSWRERSSHFPSAQLAHGAAPGTSGGRVAVGQGGGSRAGMGRWPWGRGAVALTVYSACFFPYHFIHFLNSRSMVYEATKADGPSDRWPAGQKPAPCPGPSLQPPASRSVRCMSWHCGLPTSAPPSERQPKEDPRGPEGVASGACKGSDLQGTLAHQTPTNS